VDDNGDLLVSDTHNHTLRKVTLSVASRRLLAAGRRALQTGSVLLRASIS